MKKFFDLINKNFRTLKSKSSSGIGPIYPPVITLSREMGSGGRFVASKIAETLGQPWEVFNKDIVDKISKESHFDKELIQNVDENYITVMDKFVGEIFGKKYLNMSGYYKHLVKILTTIGHRGCAVIVGRGTNFLFPHSLKVRIISDMKTRIKWMIQYEKMTEKEAKKQITDSDKKRYEFVENLFHHDIKKAHHYDLVIRTSEDLSTDDAADLIIRLAKRRFKL